MIKVENATCFSKLLKLNKSAQLKVKMQHVLLEVLDMDESAGLKRKHVLNY